MGKGTPNLLHLDEGLLLHPGVGRPSRSGASGPSQPLLGPPLLSAMVPVGRGSWERLADGPPTCSGLWVNTLAAAFCFPVSPAELTFPPQWAVLAGAHQHPTPQWHGPAERTRNARGTPSVQNKYSAFPFSPEQRHQEGTFSRTQKGKKQALRPLSTVLKSSENQNICPKFATVTFSGQT